MDQKQDPLYNILQYQSGYLTVRPRVSPSSSYHTHTKPGAEPDVYESGVHIAGHDNTTCSPACALSRKCPEDKADINYKERQGYSDTRKDHSLYPVGLSM
jgi:hypothetical protein